MMESAEASARIHGCLPRWPLFDWPVIRRVLREAVVNPILVKVRNVVTDEAPQVLFVQGNHVVQHFPPTAAHPSFCDTVLLRAPDTCSFGRQSRCLQQGDHLVTEY